MSERPQRRPSQSGRTADDFLWLQLALAAISLGTALHSLVPDHHHARVPEAPDVDLELDPASAAEAGALERKDLIFRLRVSSFLAAATSLLFVASQYSAKYLGIPSLAPADILDGADLWLTAGSTALVTFGLLILALNYLARLFK